MNSIVQSLAEVCGRYLINEKWLIAPSLRVGYQWLDQVTKSGQAVINVHAKTLRGMVLDLAASEISARGLQLLSDSGGTVIVDRILAKLRQQLGQTFSNGYFSLLPASMSLSQALYSSLTDIRLAGLDVTALDPSAFEKGEKGREIRSILVEYLEQLNKLGLVDYPTALDLAFASLTSSEGSASPKFLVLWPVDMDITKKERTLLDSFQKGSLIELPASVSTGHPHFLPQKGEQIPDERPGQQAEPSPYERPISVFSAIGEVNEVREVFRKCLSNEIPLDQVELLHTEPATYLPLIFELVHRVQGGLTDQAEAIVTFDEGIPTRYSKPGKALSAWVSWVRSDFLQSVLVTMLQEGLISCDPVKHRQTEGLVLARLLRSTTIGFKRERYVPALERLVKSIEQELQSRSIRHKEDDDPGNSLQPDANGRLQIANSLQDLVKKLLETAPYPGSSQLLVIEKAKTFLRTYAVVANEFDKQSKRVLINAIDKMESFLDLMGTVSLNIWDWLAALPNDLRVMGSGPKAGAMHVANIYNGGHTGRRHTFVIGLDDGRFPGAGLQDPVLLDSERTALSPSLPRSADQISKKINRFLRLVNNVSGNLTLGYSCRSIVDDSEMFPSPVISQILGDAQDKRSLLSSDSKGPASFAPVNSNEAMDMTEWWMSRLCRVRQIEDTESILQRHYPHLAKGNEAARQRESNKFTPFDGLVTHSDPYLDPTPSGRLVLSSSRLQTIGGCPRRYFLKYVLRLEPPQDVEPDKDTWLDTGTFGSLLHEVFHDFVKDQLPHGWPPDYPNCLAEIELVARSLAEEMSRKIPPPSDEVFRRQLGELIRSSKVFLELECQNREVHPIILEGAFGLTPKERGKRGSIVTPDPVLLTLPNRKKIKVCGIMDRIDRVPAISSEWCVILDYKSGSTYQHRSKDHFRQGRFVQHGLYQAILEAVAETVPDLTPARFKEFIFFFPGEMERGIQISYKSSDLKDWGIVLQRLSDILAHGAFIATNQVKTDCTYCDYPAICGDLPKLEKAVSLKLANQDNKVLQPMRELRHDDK